MMDVRGPVGGHAAIVKKEGYEVEVFDAASLKAAADEQARGRNHT